MSSDKRVPMPTRPAQWLADDDIALSVTSTPRVGRRIAMDISELALATMGAEVVRHAVVRLGQEVPMRHQAEIQRTVDSFLMDRSWAEPIIKQELRRAVREFVLALWSDEETSNMRDWFDLFTQKCRGDEASGASD